MVAKTRKSASKASSKDVASSRVASGSRARSRTVSQKDVAKPEVKMSLKKPAKAVMSPSFSLHSPRGALLSATREVLSKRNTQQKKPKGKKVKRAVRSTLLFLHSYERIVLIAGLFVLFGLSLFIFYRKYSLAQDKPQGLSDKQILMRVASHGISLPKEKPDGIDRVQNADALRSQAEFYKSVKEGDYVITYPHLVIVYNVLSDTIVNIRQFGGR